MQGASNNAIKPAGRSTLPLPARRSRQNANAIQLHDFRILLSGNVKYNHHKGAEGVEC
jgi:hypothetical protein